LAFAKKNGVPSQEIVGHDFAVVTGAGAVWIEEDVFVNKDDPDPQRFVLVGGADKVGNTGGFHDGPHMALIGLVVGVETLAGSSLLPESDVVFESGI